LVKALGGGWDVAQMNRETGDVVAPAPLPASSAEVATPVAQSGALPVQAHNP
jgi:hypothetical protein